MDNNLDLMNMAASFGEVDEGDLDVAALFKKNPVTGNIAKEDGAAPQGFQPKFAEDRKTSVAQGDQQQPPPKKKNKPWTPPKEVMDELPENNPGGVIYNINDIKNAEAIKFLGNVADDGATEEARKSMDEMTRKMYNIEEAKARCGIRHFQIPPGEWHARILACAGDTNLRKVRKDLDELFGIIIHQFPEFIHTWADPTKAPGNHHGAQITGQAGNELIEPPAGASGQSAPAPASPMTPVLNSDEEAKVIIDKTNVTELSWTQEELEKVRRARKISLDIKEDVTLKYTNIEEVDDNQVDVVLSKYTRKVNDIPGVLPASKYRATFTGLTYTEVLDLTNSHDMNNLDGERKKWAIAYDHIKNPSIGEFDSFEDFLKKTSFMDLDFILWKILCATCQEQEMISINCNGENNGVPCKRTYDWIYNPSSLLDMASINPAVLEEMEKTGKASSIETIESNYKESMLMTNNTVELASSKYGVVFGHISADDYLNEIYAAIQELGDNEEAVTDATSYAILTIVKYFLIPKNDGSGHYRIKGTDNLSRVIKSLDEIDWQTLTELMKIMMDPYQFRYVLRDVRCPQCNHKTNIPIVDMTRMLFIIAQSLMSVQVELKRA